jgi:hypothetical protein
MNKLQALLRSNVRLAKRYWRNLPSASIDSLKKLTRDYSLSVASGEILLIDGRWYIAHAGLLRIARRCSGIHVEVVPELSDPAASKYAFKATLYRSRVCKGFVGHGDADPSSVTSLVQGAEMRIAETRAVNRAIRKAYGIGICSVEELGSLDKATDSTPRGKKRPPQPSNGHSWGNGPRVRDRLCQIIRQHQLDATLVKSYATDFCGVKSLREATREQVENFVQHLADWAEKDRNALLCQLNSYLSDKPKEGAA